MNLLAHVEATFREAEAGHVESAVMHVCAAVDNTAKRLFPSDLSSGRRFIRCVREHYWLIEPMMGVGFNLVDSRFTNVDCIPGKPSPDFADIVYHLHRCAHAHGDDVTDAFRLLPLDGGVFSCWEFEANAVRMPVRLVWALAATVVFSRVNERLLGQGGELWLSFADQRFPVRDWWGREADLRPIVATSNTTRIELTEMSNLLHADPATPKGMRFDIVPAPLSAVIASEVPVPVARGGIGAPE